MKEKILFCRKCLLTENDHNVSFNKKGVCNFCLSYSRIKPRLSDFKTLKIRFDRRIAEAKKKKSGSVYDCLVAFSGGKDSSYMLYRLKKAYRMNILAITCDNHFSNTAIMEKARDLCRRLGVDHIYFKPDWRVLKEFYAATFKKNGSICLGCVALFRIKVLKTALEQKIPLIIIGESPDQMMTDKFYFDIGLIKSGYEEIVNFGRKGFIWETLYKKLFRQFNQFTQKHFPNNRQVRDLFYLEPAIYRRHQLPDILPYFFFHEHNEKKIIAELKRNAGWKDVKISGLISHPDCTFYPFVDLPNKKAPALSVYIRQGVIKRDVALNEYLLNLYDFNKDNAVQLRRILKRLGLKFSDIRHKRWYKSSYLNYRLT